LSHLSAVDWRGHNNQHVVIAILIHSRARGRAKENHAFGINQKDNPARDFLQKFLI
jgi:hypothetical protein